MYTLTTRSRKAEKQFHEVLHLRPAISEKLELLKQDPRWNLNAHYKCTWDFTTTQKILLCSVQLV